MCFNRFMNEIPNPPHDKEEQAERDFEKSEAIRQKQEESGSELDQTFCPTQLKKLGQKALAEDTKLPHHQNRQSPTILQNNYQTIAT